MLYLVPVCFSLYWSAGGSRDIAMHKEEEQYEEDLREQTEQPEVATVLS